MDPPKAVSQPQHTAYSGQCNTHALGAGQTDPMKVALEENGVHGVRLVSLAHREMLKGDPVFKAIQAVSEAITKEALGFSFRTE